jgi:hypothetical protein
MTAKRIHDLSHHNLRDGEHYNYTLVAQNADAIIYKCSDPEIAGGHDHTHAEAFDGFRSVMPIAEYHFDDPSSSAKVNVALYVKYSKHGFLDALDVEDAEKYSNSALTEHVVDTLKEGAQKTGRKWWLYTNLDFLNNRLLDHEEIGANIAGIWLAWPQPTASTFPKPKYYAKDAVGIWQKSWWASCPGISDASIDYGEWMWSDDAWRALVGGKPALTLEQKVAALWAAHPELTEA